MRIDPYNHKEKNLAWKEKNQAGIASVSKENSELILKYLNDMELGINIAVGSPKGSRSFIRLYSLRERMIFFAKRFEDEYSISNITTISEEQLLAFFCGMKNGKIKRIDGKQYKTVETVGKVFKAFWHWWQKINKKKGVEILDITQDLDTQSDKPDWVYLTEEEVKLLTDNAKPKYKAMIMFLFDSGIRAPTELMNVKVSDLYNNYRELNIRDEVSKTFGRKIKLMLCSEFLKDFIKTQKLNPEDYLFTICPPKVNQYLKRLAKRVLGEGTTLAGAKYGDLTMYDFRHISCCYWLPRYKSESALKYRFGWKRSEKIHYYSELLGMKDTIAEDDMLVDVTKTEIERRLDKTEREKDILNEEVNDLRNQMKLILSYVKRVNMNVEYIFDGKND